ncbi:MAG TPA: ATP-binding protein [Methylomirabilota bacterium]|nr:ATP-binding protein [Methylomirabilota bacterium]
MRRVVLVSLLLLGAGFLRERAGRRRAERSLGERLRFETLLTDHTATFSRVSAADVDREIERALRHIADFLGVDWGSFAEYSTDERTARITHAWVAEGVDRQPSSLGFEELPWILGRLQRGEVVRFSRLDELPDGPAAVDRRTLRALGIMSHVAVPLIVEGVVMGAVAFSTLRRERAWRDDFVQRLRLLGEVFVNALSRRRGEMEGQRLRGELAHTGRVATVGALTTTLAHELNQPLTAILSNAEAAEQLLEGPAPRLEGLREILQDIVKDDRRAVEVIRRLRGLLAKGTVEPAALDVNEIVAEVARLVSADAAVRDVSVRLDLAPDLPPVWGDRVQLQQVVLNLLLNALDAMADADRGGRRLLLETARGGPRSVRIAVRDSGTGLDAATLGQIFEAFYSTKSTGMGMGLTIARQIVEAHGGRLEAGNNAEGGATFSFTLPTGGAR